MCLAVLGRPTRLAEMRGGCHEASALLATCGVQVGQMISHCTQTLSTKAQVTTQADANQLGSTGSQTKQTTAPQRKTESGQADAAAKLRFQ